MKSFTPTLLASSTNQRKSGFISGAPPVMSRVVAPLAWSASKHKRMVSRVMISLRSGPASTWQWLHTWLHMYPTFTWKISSGVGLSGK